MKRALLTGTTGQDGSYLVELLLEKGYEVHGIVRRSSSFNTGRIDHLYVDPHEHEARLLLHYGDLTDSSSLQSIVAEVHPHEVYNLGAQSHVRVSFDVPEYTAEVTALGTLRLLEAIRKTGVDSRFYQASTSELFGGTREVPQRETTPFAPRSPYAAAKAFAFYVTRNYREAYGLFACNGILFNHESERRGETFVTRKITMGAAGIRLGTQRSLVLGNLNAKRDWGYAPEYVEGMWRILQHDEPDDFVFATNETHSVREFAELAFSHLGIALEWVGEGVDERGVVAEISDAASPHLKRGDVVVEVSERYYRPTEVDMLIGDYTKSKRTLGWTPKTTFAELVRIMVEADFRKAGGSLKP